MKENLTLAQISAKIKALEKKTIKNVVEIGKLLHEAEEQCKHGEYMKWVKSEFAWSHQTALNYRDIYELSQIPNILEFDKLDISISALSLLTGYIDDPDPDHQAAGMAVIEAARQHRVSFKVARKIIDETIDRIYDESHPPDDKPEPESEPEPEPESEPEPEPEPEPADDEEDESSDNGDAEDEPADNKGAEADDDEHDATTEVVETLGRLFAELRIGALDPVDWNKVIEKANPAVVGMIIEELARKLDQYNKAKVEVSPPEQTTRVKLKKKRKEPA